MIAAAILAICFAAMTFLTDIVLYIRNDKWGARP